MNILRPTNFELLGLTLLDVGALRGTSSFNFMDANGRPTNIYLMMGGNGAGKTTVLESIFGAMSLLNARDHANVGIDAIDRFNGGIQLDARICLDDGIRSKSYVISISVGTPGLLRRWSIEEIEAVGVEAQIILFYKKSPITSKVERSSESDPEAIAFSEAILERTGDPPMSLFDEANGFPTVLYFPSDRGIRKSPESPRAVTKPEGLGYKATHRFDADGSTWESSIDNLFVWFAWLNDGREELCRELVNGLIFRKSKKRLGEVDRSTLSVPVIVESGSHRIDQLSSGERQLVQLVVRIASHMTSSTIVIIDETEQHLHMVMRRRLINIIKQWACDHAGLQFVITSHQTDSMRILAPKLEEEGLVKGGCLIKPRFSPPHVS